MATIHIDISNRHNDELAGITNHDLSIILMDALAEYVAHRANGDGAAYVAKRYPNNDVYPEGPARDKKIARVNQYCKWANVLHSGYVSIEKSD